MRLPIQIARAAVTRWPLREGEFAVVSLEHDGTFTVSGRAYSSQQTAVSRATRLRNTRKVDTFVVSPSGRGEYVVFVNAATVLYAGPIDDTERDCLTNYGLSVGKSQQLLPHAPVEWVQ